MSAIQLHLVCGVNICAGHPKNRLIRPHKLRCSGGGTRLSSGGQAWNGMHDTWLRRQRFDDSHITAALDHHFDAVLSATAARDRLDEQIVTIRGLAAVG